MSQEGMTDVELYQLNTLGSLGVVDLQDIFYAIQVGLFKNTFVFHSPPSNSLHFKYNIDISDIIYHLFKIPKPKALNTDSLAAKSNLM